MFGGCTLNKSKAEPSAHGTATAGFILAVCLMFSFRQMVVKQLVTYTAANAGVADVVWCSA